MTKALLRHVSIAALLSCASPLSSANDVIYANSFEGFALLGGTIAGRALFDPNADGNLVDGEALPGVDVYLDENYNGRFDEGEPLDVTDDEGRYRFAGVGPGVWHVRQALPAPNLQTFPAGAVPPAYDRLPDEVVEYVHALPGLGNFDVPYGRNASDYPPNWGSSAPSNNAQIVDSVDLVLKPIGVRDRSLGFNPTNGAELLTLPEGASILLRFDEAIIDGPGIDLTLYSYGSGATAEQAEVHLGATLDQMQSVGIFEQSDGTLPLDLADFEIPGAVQYVRVTGLDLLGSWFGFEFVGAEALNFAAADPDAQPTRTPTSSP